MSETPKCKHCNGKGYTTFKVDILESVNRCRNCEGTGISFDDKRKIADSLKAKDVLIEELREALEKLLKHAPGSCCANFHHEKADRHTIGRQCPPMGRYEAAAESAFLLLAKLPPMKREGK